MTRSSSSGALQPTRWQLVSVKPSKRSNKKQAKRYSHLLRTFSQPQTLPVAISLWKSESLNAIWWCMMTHTHMMLQMLHDTTWCIVCTYAQCTDWSAFPRRFGFFTWLPLPNIKVTSVDRFLHDKMWKTSAEFMSRPSPWPLAAKAEHPGVETTEHGTERHSEAQWLWNWADSKIERCA